MTQTNTNSGSGEKPFQLLHTMLRVGDIERSLLFYTKTLGMKLLRKEEYPEGRFTLAFVGYGGANTSSTLELTYNWGRNTYEQGDAYGHIALGVTDLKSTCSKLESAGVKIVRSPGPMTFSSPNRNTIENISFIEDPDGYIIELIETQ